MLSKKNRYSMDADDTNMKVGQVIGDSKVASISEPETFFLTALNANRALEELLGPRADNQSKKQQMYQQIARDGFTSLDTLEEDITKNTTLNTVDTYMLASGIKSNLLTSTLKTHHTIDSQLRNKK